MDRDCLCNSFVHVHMEKKAGSKFEDRTACFGFKTCSRQQIDESRDAIIWKTKKLKSTALISRYVRGDQRRYWKCAKSLSEQAAAANRESLKRDRDRDRDRKIEWRRQARVLKTEKEGAYNIGRVTMRISREHGLRLYKGSLLWYVWQSTWYAVVYIYILRRIWLRNGAVQSC